MVVTNKFYNPSALPKEMRTYAFKGETIVQYHIKNKIS